jgi:hypothetical protein
MTAKTVGGLVARTIFVASLATISTSALRAEEGTAVQREACTPDVFRYCVMQIPNHQAIANCLNHNSYRLSKKCKLVMEGKLK